jgi:phosphatidylserine/phosphatidylglycerophosphate/cardiolipin synthase-like enzyme
VRLKQWSLSILLFCVSFAFLLYSKTFYSPQIRPQQTASLPGVTVPATNIVVLANKDYYPVLKHHFQRAEKKIEGTIYLFRITSFPDNEPADLMRELIAARKRNVDVNLILDLAPESGKEYNEANLHAGQLLKKAGIQIRFDTSGVVTHAKTFVIDDRYCFVGSHNFTHSALATNEEMSLFIDSPDLASKISEFIRQIPLSYQAQNAK